MQRYSQSHGDEIEALESIYPELEFVGYNVFVIDLAITPVEPVKVSFTSGDVSKVLHLPKVRLEFELVQQYPESKPPSLRISGSWLSEMRVNALEEELLQLWIPDEPVLFAMIDHCKNVLETTTRELQLPDVLRMSMLSYDYSVTQDEFDTYPFLCQICQSHKRGDMCTKLSNCKDVFCTDCLREYYGACIQQGYVNQVICPEPNCKSPAVAQEDLDKLLTPAQIKRFKEIKHKLALESDPNCAVVCPRYYCETLIRRNPDDNLTICPECDLAFCAICLRSWHGYFEYCRIQEPTIEVLSEYVDGDAAARLKIERQWGKLNMKRFEATYHADKAFLQYMENNNNKACPKCHSPIEKSTGCNKMTCAICHTYFCFLCSFVLNKSHPYDHYNQKGTRCYQKLFEGVDVDALNDVYDPFWIED